MPKWAKAGLVLTSLAVLTAMVWPLFWREGGSRIDRDLANVKNLSLAVEMYLSDYDQVPDPRRWSDQLMPYLKNPDIYRCSKAPDLRCAYAFNDGAVGATSHSLNGDEAHNLVTVFESDRGWNAHGGRDLLTPKPRHLGGDHYAFLDGSARWLKRGDANAPMQWQMEAVGRSRSPAADR